MADIWMTNNIRITDIRMVPGLQITDHMQKANIQPAPDKVRAIFTDSSDDTDDSHQIYGCKIIWLLFE